MTKYDEIDIVNASSYLNNDLSRIPSDELKILNNYFNSIVISKDNNINFRTSCVEAFEYYKDEPALLVLLIRKITDQSIAISYSVVPEFKNVVQELSLFLRTARTLF